MDNLVYEYIDELKSKKLSANTIDAYARDVRRFKQFIEDKNEIISNTDIVTIMAYVQFLQKDRRASSSIIRNVVAIRNFYKYLQNKGIVKDNPVTQYEPPKIKRSLPEILSVEEVDEILSAPDISSFKGIRDKAMLEIMYATGMKVSELLNLTIYDANTKLSYIRCKGSKEKERIIPIGSYAIKWTEIYLNSRDTCNVKNLDLLFFNLQGDKMTRQGFWKIIKFYAEETGINKVINSYTLRHSFAVHLVQNGADIKTIQELLGHGALATTQIYSSVSKKSKVAEIYKNTHPRA